MLYFILRETDESEIRELCIVKAKTAEEATKMVGVNWHSALWGVCTCDDITALMNTKEGYIVKQL